MLEKRANVGMIMEDAVGIDKVGMSEGEDQFLVTVWIVTDKIVRVSTVVKFRVFEVVR